MNPRNFFAELKRRNVYRVAVAYAVLAWLLVQAASIVLPTFEAPAWVLRVIIALLLLGFPCAAVFAWACEVTPEGMKRTADIAPREPMPATKANDESSVPQEQPGKPSIAVLPFDNISGDPEQEYFSDGITEDIITDLSKVLGLSVIARHTSFTYKGKGVQVQTVGKELGADFILEGSVRKAGPRVRVTGQLKLNPFWDPLRGDPRFEKIVAAKAPK